MDKKVRHPSLHLMEASAEDWWVRRRRMRRMLLSGFGPGGRVVLRFLA